GDLDVSISDNQLTVRGTLSSGSEEGVENYFLQECYWGEFSRTIALPVPVKEEEIEAVLKDGVLTISFIKVQQDTVKKIQVL
ncbi:MAG TPA: Hsp20/alpha crystallin family protein, partial [Candidatus Saccharimonadales bacterium]|nr:Hsp20/alpha crystallin family protein [Candidatus Saccharimonadales bacterium]